MSDANRSQTVLGPDCKISGDLVLENDALIEGRFSGTLRVTGTLEVAESATIEGTVLVGALVLSGKAVADVVAEGSVELTPGASMRGRVYTGQLNIADGADFEGGIHIGPRALDAAAELINAATSSSQGSTSAPVVQTSSESADAVLQRRRQRGIGNGHRPPVTNGAGHE